ncbi:Oidioi.mRNA.OKI2018_I69.PAR.g11039.t1.cds [Oikopleura dioica]|uniref:Oidioi.mRNA.OKI2018_I69.PAR.g11039.t1.cds n=1 Tax=Oikopleura dioica TaxID=34765 RepID=A0ABN7RZM7_OIKDI|nr:Oidioi.mRNA.OKI2018_I69.PAR.g11039.t1.cds [Oikopleura dioica]
MSSRKSHLWNHKRLDDECYLDGSTSSTEKMIRENNEKRRSHEFDDVYTGFQKFAEVVGPQGLRYIVNKEIHQYRRIIWAIAFLGGISFSVNMIYKNTIRFYNYPTMIKPVEGVRAEFPKVTICLNSMHSHESLERTYPGLAEILPIYYGQADPSEEIYKRINMSYLDSLDMLDVMTDTIPSYYIQACMFQKRDCINDWRLALTMYGYCLQLNPATTERESILMNSTDDNNNGGRTASLSLVVSFNKSDWSNIGWANYLEGFTLYYSAADDEALEPAKSILLTDVTRGVPIVSLRQVPE